MDKAVILAAGRGTRMQRANDSATLDTAQAAVAQSGVKALMPVGRPFIDYVLAGLADAGYRRVCLVVGPAHDVIRNHIAQFRGGRLEFDFAIQHEPLGTANAVAAAEEFAAGDPFLLLNSDNYYPASAITKMQTLSGSAVAGFTPAGLSRGNIPPKRLRSFAILARNADGSLARVLEKPDEATYAALQGSILIGMNCWRFTSVIFDACRAIPKSSRNEFELTDAVSYAISQLGERFDVLAIDEPVLDLSARDDVAEVTRRMQGVEVRL
jgi:glucose-1-phosphate thymidylyltransferase